LANAEFDGTPLRRKVRWGTEVTVHDTLQMKDELSQVHKAGCRALWLGVEDMTAKLVNKGQTVNKTIEAFNRLRDAGICPMPMMMHHDSQPLYSPGTNYGLLNQIKILQKAGAASIQVLMLNPSPGTKLYEGTFTSGQVIDRAGNRRVETHMLDGNHVVASLHRRPGIKQLNMLLAYLYFYNPFRLLGLIFSKKTRIQHKAVFIQVVGMIGVVQNLRRTLGWGLRLAFCRLERLSGPPQSPIPMRSVDGAEASHGTCHSSGESEAPKGSFVQLEVSARSLAVR
jgi:radical SAM superfamily enzyme YgiQ (UPF0313 family)